MASMSISGVVSGMDWDSMIDSIIESAAEPAQVQVNKKTNLTRKKSLFEEMKVMVQSIQTSMTPLKLPSTYNAKEIEIERLDSNASYKGVLTATVNADAEVSVHEVEVTQIARSQTNRSSQITSSNIASNLSNYGLTDSTLYISAGGQKIGVEVHSTDSLQALKSRINNTLKTLDNPMNITAYVSDNKLLLRSDYTGTGETTTEENITYNLNGYNKLSDILVTDGQESNLSINGYTQGKDYVVVNTPEGSEIRWNLYEDTDEVKLGKSITATYEFASGDVISSEKFSSADTVNVKDALNHSPSSNSNLTITDNNGKVYIYGQDFTVNDSGNIEWIASTASKPSGNYYVKYNFTGNESFTSGPNRKTGNISGLSFALDFDSLDVDKTKVGSRYVSGDSSFTITDSHGTPLTDSDGNEFTAGTDFITYASAYFNSIVVAWAGNPVATAAGLTGSPEIPSEYNLTYTPESGKTYTSDSLDIGDDMDVSTALGFNPKDYGGDFSNITIYDEDGTEYTLGTDFKFDESGNITWLADQSVPDEDLELTLNYTYGNLEVSDKYLTSDGDIAVSITNPDTGSDMTYSEFEALYNDDTINTENFYIIDSEGNRYTLGTEFDIEKGTDEDGNDNDTLAINWRTTPAGDSYNIFYLAESNNAETMTVDLTRSYTDDILAASSSDIPYYSKFEGGTTTITQGGKTFYEGVDFDIIDNGSDRAQVQWMTDSGYEWYLPASGANSRYTINLTSSDGTVYTYSAVRNYQDTIDMQDYGLTSVNGAITSVTYQGSSTHTYDLTATETDDDGNVTYTQRDSMQKEIGAYYNEGTNGSTKIFHFNWVTPERTANSLPSSGDQLTVSYKYDSNTFDLSDSDDDALLKALGFLNSSGELDDDNYTAAQNAKIILDGDNEIERSSNYIGASYENEIDELKGVTLTLKGTGIVSLDIAHDAEKAVESIQTFVDGYNDLMNWINTRMTESQVDEDTAATVDSDDFRMRWGLLHGNSLLRNTKSQMRNIVSQNFTFSFNQRVSSQEIYGTMAHNGLRSDSTLRLRIGTKFVDVPIYTGDTITDIANRINDPTNTDMRAIFYDDDGNLLEQPLIKATAENDLLVFSSTSDQEITMSGTSAMNALKMNYTYKGLYQVGISTTSTDYGKSGELEFDTDKFMTALEDNPTEVQNLMVKFAGEMDTWVKSMLTTSASGETKGTLSRQIDDIQTQIDSINEYLENYQERLDRMEESLRSKYAAAEDRISQLSQKASSIAAILNQLNGTASNSSSSTSS